MHPDDLERPGQIHQYFIHQSHRDARKSDVLARQASLLDELYPRILAGAEVDRSDIAEKEAFRVVLESICRDVISKFERECGKASDFSEHSVQLRCFGSLSSGFATKSSDMDLGLLSPKSSVQPCAPGSPIPRLLEKAFLDLGLGARLLTRTRVPIIKICEKPPPQLLANLRNEREKWESGLDNADNADLPDDVQEETESGMALGISKIAPQFTQLRDVPSYDPSESHKLSQIQDISDPVLIPDRASVPLHQGEAQSLSAYYSSAKRVLRRLGGYDLSISNSKILTDKNCEVLDTVCSSFVAGLRDPALRNRLGREQPLQVHPPSERQQNARSLLALYICAEGEAMLIGWERRRFRERVEEREQSLIGVVQTWQTLRQKAVFGANLAHHTKELQSSLEKMKKFASMQLILLEQGQYESANHYSDRTLKLLAELSPQQPDTDADLRRHVIEKYVTGIQNCDIRQAVAEFSAGLRGNPSLRGTFLRHKTLQLAREFERALVKGLYPDTEKENIEKYMLLLRGPLKSVSFGGTEELWVVPVTNESASVLAAIRELPDPAILAPNRPKDPYNDKLEFPKAGVGVQCDINFAAHLALQNTLLLRCYSHTDARVRPMILFIKHWSKVRGINSPYRGTLSSYGYVIMALHFLINVAQPFVCPNLQMLAPTSHASLSTTEAEEQSLCMGRDVRFWRDEQEILRLAQCNSLNQNRETIGQLLRGFFEYYAQSGALSTLSGRGFDWGREVVSIRTAGGLLTKQEKGWTGAKTVTVVDQIHIESTLPRPAHGITDLASSSITSSIAGSQPSSAPLRPTHRPQKSCEVKEIRHRYLFAIEDPFEVDHNIARTVTHNGIVSIRDEFRRAWRIIQNAGHGRPDEDLLEIVESESKQETRNAFLGLINEIHGAT